ncbi:cation transporter [Thermodesulfobacteriota bacterium]
MKRLKSLIKNRTILLVILIFFAITAALAFGNILSRDITDPRISAAVPENTDSEGASEVNNDLSKVILSVKDMSCSGCVSTIKASLADIKGIKNILVDIGGGRTEVYYENNILKDVSKISDAITSAGYPANVQRIVLPDELKKERALAEVKSLYYIASVGGWDIARTDFDIELEFAKGRYSKIYGTNLFASAKGQGLLEKLKSQIVSKLLDEGVIMQEIRKVNYQVTREAIEEELDGYLEQMGKNREEFRSSLSDTGYNFNYFKKKFETKVFINRYINDKILADASNPEERQNMFAAWFNNTKTLAEVVYYDKDLENLIRNQNSSAGCGTGGK